jgi:DNA-binding LytR/AlgR family response regulator
MEARLRGRNFLRIAQSFLVSVDAVKAVRPAAYKEAVLRDGTIIPVGRKYYIELKNAIEQKAVTS